MKNSTILIAFLLVLCFPLVKGQNSSSQDDSVKIRKNIVKMNLTALAFRNYKFTYERAINKRLSAGFEYGFIPEGKFPLVDKFLDDEDLVDIENVKFNGNQITIDLRLYAGKGYGRGFYIGTYFRHSKYSVKNLVQAFDVTNENGETSEIDLNLNGDVSSNSFGFKMGTQWAMGKKKNFVLDWYFLAGHYGKATGDLKGLSNRELTKAEQEDLQLEINDEELPLGIKIDYNVNSKGATAKVDSPWVGYSGGLSFGYRF